MNLRAVFGRGIPLALLVLMAVSEAAVAHSGGEAHPHDSGGGVPWLEIGGIALVGFIVLRLVMRNVGASPGDSDLEDEPPV